MKLVLEPSLGHFIGGAVLVDYYTLSPVSVDRRDSLIANGQLFACKVFRGMAKAHDSFLFLGPLSARF